jgi:hypothetical protein
MIDKGHEALTCGYAKVPKSCMIDFEGGGGVGSVEGGVVG